MDALSGSVGDLSLDHSSTGLAVVAAATSLASPTGVFEHGAAVSFSFTEKAEQNVPLANERGVAWTEAQDTMPQTDSRDQRDDDKRPRRTTELRQRSFLRRFSRFFRIRKGSPPVAGSKTRPKFRVSLIYSVF